MKTLFTFKTNALLSTAVALGFGLATPASAGDWGGSGGWSAPTDWSGQAMRMTVETMQGGDVMSMSSNDGYGQTRSGFTESIAEQDLTTDVRANANFGDPDCATCENDTTNVMQSLLQRGGGLAYQRSEGPNSLMSMARSETGAVGKLDSIVQRYQTDTDDSNDKTSH